MRAVLPDQNESRKLALLADTLLMAKTHRVARTLRRTGMLGVLLCGVHPGCKGPKKKNVNQSPRNRESYSAAGEFFFRADFAWVTHFQHGSAPCTNRRSL